MTDERELRDAFRAIAETDPIDETTGWAAVTKGIATETTQRRRRRVYLGGAGLAVLGAAAALVVIAAGNDPKPDAVDTTPATEVPTPTTAQQPVDETTTSSVLGIGDSQPIATTGPVPEHPLLVLRRDDEAGVTYLHVFDADSGQLLGTPAVEPNFSLGEPVIGPDGTVYFDRETGDTTHIEAIAWGTTESYAPFGIGDESSSPAISPDGSTFAYVERGVTITRPAIVLVDTATGNEIRRLEWRADDPDFFHTQGSMRDLEWSPDGSRLLFISSYEGAEALVVDADAASLSDAAPVANLDVVTVGWANEGFTAVAWCCFPDYAERPRAYLGDSGSLEPILGTEIVDDIDANSAGEIAVAADGGLTIIGTDGQRRDVIGTGSGVRTAELF